MPKEDVEHGRPGTQDILEPNSSSFDRVSLFLAYLLHLHEIVDEPVIGTGCGVCDLPFDDEDPSPKARRVHPEEARLLGRGHEAEHIR